MLLFRRLEVGHVHTAAFVISDRPINHGRAVSMPSGFALQVACPSGCRAPTSMFSLLSSDSYPSVL